MTVRMHRPPTHLLIAALVAVLLITGGSAWLSATGRYDASYARKVLHETIARRSPGGPAPERLAPLAVTPRIADGTTATPPESPYTDRVFEAVTEREVPVLVFHHITPSASGPASSREYEMRPEEFDALLAELQRLGYQGITAQRLSDAFDGIAPLPERPVILAMDDGRANQYAHAFPLLKARGYVAVFYVFTNAIDRPGYLTREQLIEMRDAGMEIASHTRYHPFLTRSGDAELENELTASRDALAELLGSPPSSIAYPFGLYDDRVVDAAVAAGYTTGRTLDHGVLQRREDRMRLRAHIMLGDTAYLDRVLGINAQSP